VKPGETVKKAVDNVKDTIHEGVHRSNAEGEKAKRELLGDEMAPGDKVKSVANQTKETVQAEYDAAKRDVRKNT